MRKSRDLLNPVQRELFMRIPDDFSDRDIARYYTFSPQELAIIKRQNGARNRLGFAVQLAVLRFPGRTLNEISYIPDRVLNFIAEQVGESVEELEKYGTRAKTRTEHLTKIRKKFGYRDYGWSEMLFVTRRLLPVAMETEQRLPLIEVALTIMRENQIIAPGMPAIEHLVVGVHRMAKRRVFLRLTRSLTDVQRTTLESIPKKDGTTKGRTRLGWLRAAPGLSSKPENLMAVLNRIAFLQNLQLPPLPDDVPINRIRQMARRCRQYKPQALRNRKPVIRRHALMVAYCSEMPRELTDLAVDMFDRMMADLLRKGDSQQRRQMEKNAPTLNSTVQVLATAVEAFLKAYTEKLDPFKTVFDAVSESELVAALQATKAIVRPADMDSLDLIEDRYERRRKALLFMYRLLKFSAVQVAEPVLRALNHILKLADSNQRVVAVKQKVKDVRVVAPVAYMLKTRWKKHALKQNNLINANYYELAAFDLLRARLRSGDIAVENSRRYQAFYKGMLSVEKWQELKATNQTRLAISGTAQQYFDEVHQHFTRRMKELTETFDTNPSLKLGDQGQLVLVPYETDVPEAAKKFGRTLYKRVPVMQIPDLALEVHGWTNCLDRFTDAITNKPTTGRDRQILLAALLALGMNIGFKKMAQATGFSYSDLNRVARTYIREETIRRALRDLDNFALTLPMAAYWGDGTATSSDGMRVVVAVKAANADYNARYFGNQRGLTFLTHTADIQIPLSPRVISTNEREALYTIDLLESHETDLNIQEHYTEPQAIPSTSFRPAPSWAIALHPVSDPCRTSICIR
jgi:TnpA family transposase